EGIDENELSVKKVTKEKIIQSQKASFVHRQDLLKFRKTYLKIKLQKRDKFVKKVTIPYILVQVFRRITRKKSIELWRKQSNVFNFNKSMKLALLNLKIVTKFNHKLRK